MTKGFSQYQQSQLGVSAAKARAISERSQAQFRTGLTAVQEKEALERAADQLEQIAKEAERNARRRGRRASFGRLLGSTVGFVLGGPAGKAALGTALGGLAGSAAAGGFKKYDVDVPDSLVPGGIFYGREREAFKQRADDIEEAMKDLTKEQRKNIGKNVLTDFLIGRGLGKLGEAKIGDLDVSLDDLLETGKISKKDYLVDILRSSAGGIGKDRMSVLRGLSEGTADKFVSGFQDPSELISRFASNQKIVDKPGELEKLLTATQGLTIDPETGTYFDSFLEQLPRGIQGTREEQMSALSKLRPDITPRVSSDVLSESLFGASNVSGQSIQTAALPKPTAPQGSLRGLIEGTSPTGISSGNQRFLDFRDTDGLIKNLATGQLTEEYEELLDDDTMKVNNLFGNPKRNNMFQFMVGPMGGMR